ncbi:unnamed protein product, partial [Closterium sp. Yama58-4]
MSSLELFPGWADDNDDDENNDNAARPAGLMATAEAVDEEVTATGGRVPRRARLSKNNPQVKAYAQMLESQQTQIASEVGVGTDKMAYRPKAISESTRISFLTRPMASQRSLFPTPISPGLPSFPQRSYKYSSNGFSAKQLRVVNVQPLFTLHHLLAFSPATPFPPRSYKYSSNGFSAELTVEQLRRLKRHPAVASVRPSARKRLFTTESPTFLGMNSAGSLWPANGGQAKAGDGTVVAIVDTGIWPEHPSFSDAGFSSSRPAGCAAAGNKGVPMAGGKASGMAPAARLVAYKVFWSNGEDMWAEEADIIAAVNQGVADGVDVISLSLGAVNPEDTYFDDIAFLNANLAGVVVTFAAGNDGPPQGYRSLDNYAPFYLTVGASTIARGGLTLARSASKS